METLLENIYEINKKYKEFAEISGANYNIFKILKMESSEVRMHSAFLSNLLDPEGSHGLKDKFLKAFINQFKIPYFEDMIEIKAKVLCEETIRNVNEDFSSGGRIDIVIKSKSGNVIVIENKIYASDQSMQLVRYKKHYPNAHLLYLTLEGKSPNISSIKDIEGKQLEEGKDYHCISYKNGILCWLNQCRKESTNFPMLREAITQYIHLIKHLTGQTMNVKMNNEIISRILNNPENIESAQIISGSWEQVKLSIMEDIKDQIIKRDGVAEKVNLKVDFNNTLGLKDSGFWFYKEEWKHCIYFCFDDNFEKLLMGIATRKHNDEIDANLKKQVQTSISNRNFGKILNYSNWLWVCRFDEWEGIEWKNVREEFPNSIFEAVNSILKDLEGIDL